MTETERLAALRATPPTAAYIACVDAWAARIIRHLAIKEPVTFEERQRIVERAVIAAHRELVMALAERAQERAAWVRSQDAA